MNESQLPKIFNYPKYPRDSKIITYRRFVKIDNGNISGSHWNCFIIKDNKSFYFFSFGDNPDKFLLSQLSRPIIHHSYRIRDANFKLCGSYC